MCDIDLEPCTVWVQHERTARKPHACESCSGVIAPGSRYFVFFSVFDGHASSEKMCTPCRAAMTTFGDADGHMECMPSYFPELLASCVSEGDDADAWRPMLDALRARAEVAA